MPACNSVSMVPSSDQQLLKQFLADRDEESFTQIVSRHSSMVMGLCRRTLGNQQDAEDAFQATFLVLARKAATIRSTNSLSAWLYKTAYRIAIQMREKRANRRESRLEVDSAAGHDPFSKIADQHELAMLDEELHRLPDKYRLPLFLCCVDGVAREAAAEQLGVSPGAIKGRLERGRHLLRSRLMLRGVSFSVALGAAGLLQQVAHGQPIVSSSLVSFTAKAGLEYAAGDTLMSDVSHQAISMANASAHATSVLTVKTLVSSLVLIAVITGALLPMFEHRHGESSIVVYSLNAKLPERIERVSSMSLPTGTTQLDDPSIDPLALLPAKKRCCKHRKVPSPAARCATELFGDTDSQPDAERPMLSVLVAREI